MMGVIPDYKDLYELFKKAGNVEAQEQIMQLREEHLRQKEALLRAQDEIRELKVKLEVVASVKFEMPYYWRVTELGQDGPFCQVCFDKDAKLVRLQSRSRSSGAWDCNVCSNYFTDRDHVEVDWNASPQRNEDWMGV